MTNIRFRRKLFATSLFENERESVEFLDFLCLNEFQLNRGLRLYGFCYPTRPDPYAKNVLPDLTRTSEFKISLVCIKVNGLKMSETPTS